MKEINLKFDLSRVRNAEHYQLHDDILRTVTAAFATAQGIAPLREKYQALFDTETTCYLQNRSYQNTTEIETSDKNRDDYFLYISQTIATGKYCPIEAKKEAAVRLGYALELYKDAPRMNYASNTAAVKDFVLKVGEPQYADAIATLGLSDAITALNEANEAFNTLYSSRSSEVLSRNTSESMRTIRPQVDTAYREFASAINALYQVNALVAKSKETEQAIGTVIDSVNALIIQLQQTLSRAGVGAKSNFKPRDNKPSPIGPDDSGDSESPDII